MTVDKASLIPKFFDKTSCERAWKNPLNQGKESLLVEWIPVIQPTGCNLPSATVPQPLLISLGAVWDEKTAHANIIKLKVYCIAERPDGLHQQMALSLKNVW